MSMVRPTGSPGVTLKPPRIDPVKPVPVKVLVDEIAEP
jgi:hypothetical protein